jgi:hypothetical protein
MVTTYQYGHDYGNTETAGVLLLNGRHHHLTVPQGTLSDLERIRSATGQGHASSVGVLQQGEYALVFRNTEFFIGTLALTQSRTSSTGKGDMNRYWNQRSLEMLLTVSGTIIPERDYRLNVVTGLPIETFNVSNRKRVKEALEGVHEFVLNGRPRIVEVKVSRVIMEGAGAIIAYGSSDPIKQGAIDIGGRTTDVFASDGQMPLLPLCKGKALGVELAADRLSSQAQAKYLRPLTAQETREVLRAYVNKSTYPKLFASGTRIPELDLIEWSRHVLRSIGSEIASFVSQVWNNSEYGGVAGDIAKVLLVGGGAYYFREDIQKIIPHVEIPMQPELANAIGYAALADQVSAVSRIA